MNTRTLLATAIVSFIPLLAADPARAGISDGLGSWEGSGTVSEASGADLGAFTVSLVRKRLGSAVVRADGVVTLASGQRIVFWQELEDRAKGGLRLVSNNGSGGGRCFPSGMCAIYEERADGHAFSTSIAVDGPDKMRILVTELDHGKAIRFVQQTLSKKP